MKYPPEHKKSSILEDMICYADYHKGFDRTCIDDIRDFMVRNGYITSKHLKVLSAIYRENCVYEFFKEDT